MPENIYRISHSTKIIRGIRLRIDNELLCGSFSLANPKNVHTTDEKHKRATD